MMLIALPLGAVLLKFFSRQYTPGSSIVAGTALIFWHLRVVAPAGEAHMKKTDECQARQELGTVSDYWVFSLFFGRTEVVHVVASCAIGADQFQGREKYVKSAGSIKPG